MPERRDISPPSGEGAMEPRGVAGPDEKAARESDHLPFGVVGIGASAGGIEAFRSLLGALPGDTGMAYVLVQHLSPDHPSILAQTPARFTSMPVHETGMGVPREFIPHLFSRFSQADGSATRLHGGLGLGLAIVKHLVDLHGGTVGAESAGEGHGATFWVTVPLVGDARPGAAALA